MASSHPTFLVPRGCHVRLLPTSGAMMMAEPVPHSSPGQAEPLHGWGRATLSLAFGAVDMCVPCLTLPVTSLPGAVLACLSCSVCLLQSPLTLSLTQAGLASPATRERKRTRLVGLVPHHVFIRPQDARCQGWEDRGPGVTGPEFWAGDRDAALFSHPTGGTSPSCASQGPWAAAGTRLVKD